MQQNGYVFNSRCNFSQLMTASIVPRSRPLCTWCHARDRTTWLTDVMWRQ